MDRSAGQLPDQPGVDRAEQKLASLCPLPGAFHMVQNPFHFGAREVGIYQQTCLLPE
ncbi:hypothetical protein D3C81_704860 [compost metagenome]